MQASSRRSLDIVLYDCGWGAGDFGCEDGPHAAQLDHAITPLLTRYNVILSDLKLRDLGERKKYKDKYQTFPKTLTSVTKLAQRSFADTKNGVLPVVIGGDHSSAIGTWSGVVSALKMEEDFGLIWVDAHMDAHTPETSEQGKWGGWWHGMPVASLTGHGAAEFTGLVSDRTKLKPEHIVLIGIRSFEPGEEAYIKKHNIKCYMAEDVEQRGFQAIFEEALAHVRSHCKGFGVSIDLDGFDPKDAPGVGTPEKRGIPAHDAVQAFAGLGDAPDFHGLEIVEYNPHKDEDKKTEKLIHALLNSFFPEK